jgi:predicted ribonuclease YlaK
LPATIWQLPMDLSKGIPDHEIISTALGENESNGNRKTILVSRDINMRVICDSIGLISEDYTENEVIKKESDLYTGFRSCLVDDQ